MVELKFKPKGPCLEWRLQIRNETRCGAFITVTNDISRLGLSLLVL